VNDGVNQYLYDGEGRICAVANGSALIGYIYNAEGQRVAMGTISAWSCDPAVNGFRATNEYVLGLSGEQVTEMAVAGNTMAWQHTNVYAAGSLNGADAYNVGLDHFRTSDSETDNLDAYIVDRTVAYMEGNAPDHKLCFYDCRDYAIGGLVAAGVLGKGQAHAFSLYPNGVFDELSGIANQQIPHEPKATVTTSECDTLPDGTRRCQ
jgi:hypothetical protein